MRSSTGISTIASPISLKVWTAALPDSRLRWSSASSDGVGGSSGVDSTDTSTVPMENTAPSMNDPKTQYGMPAAVPPVMSDWNTNRDTFANVMPSIVKNDWARKPLPTWEGGSRSAMKAR